MYAETDLKFFVLIVQMHLLQHYGPVKNSAP